MTRRRWIADESSGNRAALTGDHAVHLSRVLRARLGQEFDIATPSGVRRGHITKVSEQRVEFELGEAVDAAQAAEVVILLAIFKFDRYEWAVEKLTELGIAHLVPLIAHRTDPHLAAAAGKRAERWRRVSLAAAEQSRRDGPPEISAPASLHQALAHNAALRVVLAEPELDASARQLSELLADHQADQKNGSSLGLAIGPEGGWTSQEMAAFRQHGWQNASLGPLVLRAETAAIAAAAIAAALWQ